MSSSGVRYTLHRIPQGFWLLWNSDKKGMKEKGFSPFKRGDEWFVGIYRNGDVATAEEKAQYNKDRLKLWMQYMPDPETDAQWKLLSDMSDCSSIKEAIELCEKNADMFEDVNKFIEQANDGVFEESISPDIKL